jgi:hypothetical protein
MIKLFIKYVGLLGAGGLMLTDLSGAALDWSRQTTEILDDQSPFTIVSVASRDGEISAGAVYRYLNKKAPVVLKGRKNSFGDFWPSVSYEVAADGRKTWKSITSLTQPDVSVSVVFDTKNNKGLFRVNMEPFRSVIGKSRWGRVVLPGGDAAEIMLDNLLPPPESRSASGDFKKDVVDSNPTRFESLFALVSITSVSKHLVGDFVFYAGDRTYTELEGSYTADGEFWPVVTFQCGNDNGEWQTLGISDRQKEETLLKLSSRGSLRPIRVPLDVYRTCEGRFKYGRLVFGAAEIPAVFRISDLEPKISN